MKNLLSDIDSKVGTLAATILGFALMEDFTIYEQNAIGNWFMLVGQVLETNVAFLQVKQNKYNNQKSRQLNAEIDIEKLKKIVEIMQREINELSIQIKK